MCSEKFGGSRVYAKVRYGSGTAVLDIFIYIYSPSIVINMYTFPFPLAPAKIIGNVQMNRQYAAIFTYAVIYWCYRHAEPIN